MTDTPAGAERSATADPSAAPAPTATADERHRQWYIVERWQEYIGETRANLMRIAAIACFYVIELLNYYGLSLGPLQFPPSVGGVFHEIVTWLAIAWTMVSLATLLCLRLRFFPAAFKYVTTAFDLTLLTMTLLVGGGLRSPLVAGYFLIIAASALRFRLGLVWFATLGSVCGYLCIASRARLMTDEDVLLMPRYQQLIVLASLLLAGAIIGQVVRRVRAMAEDFATLVG